MGRYIGQYQQSRSPDLAVIPDVRFKEAFTPAIDFRQPAVIDTGADFGNIPADIVRSYRLPSRDRREVYWPDGSVQKRPVYLLRVEVPNLRAITERFIDYGLTEILLGRNLLNRWRLVLDPSHNTSQYGIIIEDR